MRMERVSEPDGLDFAIYGIPFDTTCSYCSRARFGPQGIRNISVMMKTNNPVYEVNILDYLKGADMGDVNIVPGYIHPTYAAIEAFASRILDAGAVTVLLTKVKDSTLRSVSLTISSWNSLKKLK